VKMKNGRRYVAVCTSIVGSVPLLYLLVGWSSHDWLSLAVCVVITAACAYALVISRGFQRIGHLTAAQKAVVFATGIPSMLLVSLLMPIAIGLWAFSLAVTAPAPAPIEVKLAREPWTGKLK
jgi:hypothetical protein